MWPSVYWKLCFTMTIGCVLERLWTERYSNHSSPLWVSASEVLEYEISCRRRWSGIAVSFLIEWDLGKTSLKNRSSLIWSTYWIATSWVRRAQGNGPRNGGRATLNKILLVFRQKQEAVPVQAQSPFLSIHCLCLLPKPHSVTHCFYQTTITWSTCFVPLALAYTMSWWTLLLFCCCSFFLNILLGI